jgi:site-specific DNA-methyltransferase (adenine-specific)
MNDNPTLTITNEDNMELMKRYPDNYFDLAIVDPPYGINMMSAGNLSRGKLSKVKNYKKIDDSHPPSIEYFNELFRVSKNQIIWGANHMMDLIKKRSSCWIVWQKNNGSNDFADAELAYTSFNTTVRVFNFTWNGMIQGDMKNKEIRIHITQKPVALYKWLLEKYAKQECSNLHCEKGVVDNVYGEIVYCSECQNRERLKILDTHLGSGSIAIACHDYGYDLTACELDKDYFDKAMERINNHKKQLTLF